MHIFLNKRRLIYCLLCFFVFLFFSINSVAQLDSVHYLPPLNSPLTINQQSIYLSTPEAVPFTVEIVDPLGNVFFVGALSNAAPVEVPVPVGAAVGIMQPVDSVGVILSNSGFIASGPQDFYCNYRTNHPAQATSITCKGEAALGTIFYTGALPQTFGQASNNFETTIMATEDGTTIEITGYDPGVVFKSGAGGTILSDTITLTLNRFQSYIIMGETTVGTNASGFTGAKIQSDLPIAVNTGNCLGGHSAFNRDFMLDQIVPIELVGEEYVLVRGTGHDFIETVLVVATAANTSVYVNGAAAPIAVLANPGDYYLIPESFYTGTLHENMFIESSAPIYVYQFIGVSNRRDTGGLNFVPSVNCFLPYEVNQIPDTDRIGTSTYTGNIILTTTTGSTVLVNGVAPTAAQGPEPVAGSAGVWETYEVGGLAGDVSAISDGPLIVGFYGAVANAGFAGYYSGFGALPELIANGSLNGAGTNFCLDGLSLIVDNPSVSYQWLLDDVPISGANSQTYNPVVGGNYSVQVSTGTACIDTTISFFILDCILLPVELGGFSVNCNVDSKISANWNTITEHDNDYFVLQGAIPNNQALVWENLGTIDGAGNSLNEINYSIRFDNQGHQYFRLKQVDFSGNTYFSDIIVNTCIKYTPFFTYDPASSTLTAHLESNVPVNTVEVFDSFGRIVKNIHVEQIGEELLIDLSPFSSGVYFVKINDSMELVKKY